MRKAGNKIPQITLEMVNAELIVCVVFSSMRIHSKLTVFSPGKQDKSKGPQDPLLVCSPNFTPVFQDQPPFQHIYYQHL